MGEQSIERNLTGDESAALKKSSGAVKELVDAIMLDKKRVLPCSVLLNGEYGVTDLYVGVPIKLGAGGVEQIIELNLTSDESAALKKSSDR